MSTKSWIICTGSKYETKYAHMFHNKTKEEIGYYIKTHVDELMGHFETISGSENLITENNIHNILTELRDDIQECETSEEYNIIVIKITERLSKLSDITVFFDFYYRDDLSYTSIVKYEPHLGERINDILTQFRRSS